MTVANGNTIKVEYTGTLEDGTVFDSSERHGKPLEVTLGKGMLIPGFENALIGMEKDQEKEITLQPKDAYGDRHDQLIQKVPKARMPKDIEVQQGMTMMITLPDGQQIPGQILEVGDQEVTIDVNHPLAGKVLKFKLKVIDISS